MTKFSPQLQGTKYPKWEPEYVSALTEIDSLKLKERIHIAQAALMVRSMDKANPPDQAERQAIQDAESAMRTLLLQINGAANHAK